MGRRKGRSKRYPAVSSTVSSTAALAASTSLDPGSCDPDAAPTLFWQLSSRAADIIDMGCRLRLWEPNVVYSATIRTNDRQFLLKPNHDLKHPLLGAGCPVQALDKPSSIIPVPSIINTVGSAFARALNQHPVQLHWLESNITHLHVGISATPDQIENLSPFFQHANSLI